jgi:hypothetical protein
MPETGAGLEGGPSMGTDGMSSSGYSLLSIKNEGNDKAYIFGNERAINHLEEDSVNSLLKRKCSSNTHDCRQKGTTDEFNPASQQNMTFNNKLATIITKRTPDFGSNAANGQLFDMTPPAKRPSHNSAIQRPGGRDPRIKSDFPIGTTYPDENGCGESKTKTECPIHLTDQDVNLLVQTTDGVFYDKGLIKNGMIYNSFSGDQSCNNNIWAGYSDHDLQTRPTNQTLKRQSSAHYDKFWHRSNFPVVVSDSLLDSDHDPRYGFHCDTAEIEARKLVWTTSTGQNVCGSDLSEDLGTNTFTVSPNTQSSQVNFSGTRKFEFNSSLLMPNNPSISTKSDQLIKARMNLSPSQGKVNLDPNNSSLDVNSLRSRNLMSGLPYDPIEEMVE